MRINCLKLSNPSRPTDSGRSENVVRYRIPESKTPVNQLINRGFLNLVVKGGLEPPTYGL